MTEPTPTGGFTITRIVLIESTFRFLDQQTKVVSEPGAEQEQQLQLSVSLSSIRSDPKEPGNLQHRLKTSVTGKISGNAIWEATVVYLGDFSLESPAEVTLEQVQSIHAPAMLYSYAREHIADLIRRANLGALVLPPMNFAKVSGQTG